MAKGRQHGSGLLERKLILPGFRLALAGFHSEISVLDFTVFCRRFCEIDTIPTKTTGCACHPTTIWTFHYSRPTLGFHTELLGMLTLGVFQKGQSPRHSRSFVRRPAVACPEAARFPRPCVGGESAPPDIRQPHPHVLSTPHIAGQGFPRRRNPRLSRHASSVNPRMVQPRCRSDGDPFQPAALCRRCR